jgi:TPR repeat protein
MSSGRGAQIGFMAALLLASACVPAPKAPEAPPFDPKVVFRDLAKGSSRPMVVDWTPDDRASLESRASHGPILVRITEAGIEPLWDCAIPDGSKYEFTGVSPKRDHVDAHSDAELAANFPVGFAKLRAGVRSGQSISADVRLVGVAELNRLSVKRADLPAACQSATHFVKELSIGGFQFGSGATSEGGAGAGAGGMGVDANYKGVSNRITEEGDFKVCEAADPDSRTAPGRCKGILRIRLVPIGEDANKVQTTCAAGMRWDGRACIDVEAPAAKAATATAAKPAEPPQAFECEKTNLQECLEQCKKGSGSSCTFAGALLQATKKASLDDLKTIYTAACNGKSWEGCSTLADIMQVENKDVEAAKLHGVACLNGFSGACTNYGVAAYFGRGGVKEDRSLAFKLWDRACRLGDFVACSNAGVVVNKGEGGVKQDKVLARKLFDVSCKNDDPGGCTNYGFMLEHGIGGSKDAPGALRLYLGACEKNNGAACVNGGLAIEEGAKGDRTRIKQALTLYEQACNLESVGDGCASYEENKANHGDIMNDEQLQRRSCDGSTQSELGCFNAAVVYADDKLGFKNQAKMVEFAKRACKSPGAKKELCKNFK